LRTSDGGTAVVRANRPYDDYARTYNLTVKGLHTYYVLAGKTPVLVHNATCSVPISKERWHHIWKGHVNRKLNPGKSKFTTTSKAKIESMIGRALDGQTADGVYFYRFPEPIGKVLKNGVELPQYHIRVVVRDGKLITAFPSNAP
jgi:hypothetical protein